MKTLGLLSCIAEDPMSLCYYSKLRIVFIIDNGELGSQIYSKHGSKLCKKESAPTLASARTYTATIVRFFYLSFFVEAVEMMYPVVLCWVSFFSRVFSSTFIFSACSLINSLFWSASWLRLSWNSYHWGLKSLTSLLNALNDLLLVLTCARDLPVESSPLGKISTCLDVAGLAQHLFDGWFAAWGYPPPLVTWKM